MAPISPLFVLLNGPPGCGKTTLKRMLVQEVNNTSEATAGGESFASPIKEFLASSLRMPYDDIDKNTHHPTLLTTPHQFLIDLSQEHMKPRYGEDIFARLLLHRVKNSPPKDVVVVDDLGFVEEALAIWPHVIVRVHRAGHTFSGDSRGYISPHRLTIINDGTKAALEKAAQIYAKLIVRNFREGV